MNSNFPDIPPDRLWIRVLDLPSAISALNVLLTYILEYKGSTEDCDFDEV